MDLAYFLGRAWDFILWFAGMVVGTVANSIFGGWNAVFILAGAALVLFLITSLFFRRRSDDSADVENNWTRAGLIAVVAIMVIAVGARTFYGVGLPSQVTLINRSAETVSDARLSQRDHVTTLGAIEPGQMRSADFIAQEGSLTLTVTFNSGRKLSADNVGYTVAAIPVIVYFTVDGDKVELLDITNRNPKRLF